MSVFLWSLLTVLYLPGFIAVRWSGDLEEGEQVYTCAGGSLSLPWNMSVSGEEVIVDIQWHYSGLSQELIATFVHGSFLVMPSFSHRVEHVQMGGLFFKQVLVSDTGNYTIEINGYNESGAFFSVRKTALVRVGDSLMTTDGSIHVTEETKAAWDNSDQQFHFVLSCGTFTYITHPPFEVEWTLPGDIKENSTFFRDGKFQLLLDNPIKGGTYSCRIPLQSAAAACLPGGIPKHVTDETYIDSIKGRLTVLETQQSTLQEDNQKLKTDNSNLTSEMELINNQLQGFKNRTGGRQITFHARLSQDFRVISSGSTIVFGLVANNQGNAYNSSTGKFTAPVNATYFFSVTTYLSSVYSGISADIVVNDSVICSIRYLSSYTNIGICQAVASLRQGQQVWLKASSSYSYYFTGTITTFTGFIINAD